MSEPTTSEPVDPSDTPLAAVDPDSITALFDADSASLSDDAFKRLIVEYRRRADVHKAEAAAEAARPKGARRGKPSITDAALAALVDKPVSELSAADLFSAEAGGLDG